jgi:hypothetical protein
MEEEVGYQVEVRITRLSNAEAYRGTGSVLVDLLPDNAAPLERWLYVAIRQCADKALAAWRDSSGAGRDPEEKP